MNSDKKTLQAGRDRRTGFPCIREKGTERFVSVFPIAKLQVEQWLWSGGFGSRLAPELTTGLLERMELNKIPRTVTGLIYPESIKKLSRTPISQLTEDNLPSIIATNLKLWSTPEETKMQDVRFPTPKSEWGRVLNWLEGAIPDAQKWRRILNFYRQFRTKDLIKNILGFPFQWSPVVESLLRNFVDILSGEERGLPFMNLGVYELIADRKLYKRFAVESKMSSQLNEFQLNEFQRPFVAGESAIWPTLETSGSNKWRPVLKEDVPVVTIRPFYEEQHVVDKEIRGNICEFPLTTELFSDFSDENESAATETKEQDASLKNPVSRGKATMANRCPSCYEVVAKDIFENNKALWCYMKRVVTRSEDGDVEAHREHSNIVPPKSKEYREVEAINRDYLTIARKSPSKIRSICLSGFERAGKGAWLLSLAGLMSYPHGKSYFRSIIPENWNFDFIMCDMKNPQTTATIINLLRQVEDLWIDGDVPERTRALNRALRTPFLFCMKRSSIPFGRKDCILIFNDISGEIVGDAVGLEQNKEFSHLGSSNDVIFIQPAHEIDFASNQLRTFTKALGSVTFEDETLDCKKLNLIFAVSQIDRLKFGSTEDNKLLNIFIRQPYVLPRSQNESDLQYYLSGVKDVHYLLRDWLKKEKTDIYKACEQYGSVRFCGFSSFGFEAVQKGRKPGVQAYLPFEPQPIRVLDPLFWLLRDNGLIRF